MRWCAFYFNVCAGEYVLLRKHVILTLSNIFKKNNDI